MFFFKMLHQKRDKFAQLHILSAWNNGLFRMIRLPVKHIVQLQIKFNQCILYQFLVIQVSFAQNLASDVFNALCQYLHIACSNA